MVFQHDMSQVWIIRLSLTHYYAALKEFMTRLSIVWLVVYTVAADGTVTHSVNVLVANNIVSSTIIKLNLTPNRILPKINFIVYLHSHMLIFQSQFKQISKAARSRKLCKFNDTVNLKE